MCNMDVPKNILRLLANEWTQILHYLLNVLNKIDLFYSLVEYL